jgi:phosphoserine phosphatase RsbU/P
MPPHPLTADLLRQNIPALVLASWFVFVGLASCSIAVVRRRTHSRFLVWFGLFIGLYGLRMLAEQFITLQLTPAAGRASGLITFVDYVLVIPAILFWVELSWGWLRRVFISIVLLACGTAVLGFIFYLAGLSRGPLLRFNSLLAIGSMLALAVILSIPGLTHRRLLIRTGILRWVLPALALTAITVNLLWLVDIPPPAYLEPVSFVVWIFALGYEAASRTFANERRLIAIDTELDTARRMQAAILPSSVPSEPGLRIVACYKPVSAVAGDFYTFVPLGSGRLGLFVADVTGHGVPAALVASMIKVAMQSVLEVADDPAEALSRLNHILTPEMGGSLASAAYLLIDREQRTAVYSSAGHPPLLHWISGERRLERIESNGLLFGVMPHCTYPSARLQLEPGDRLLLYTDGLSEPENAAGEPFGDIRLEQVIAANPELDAGTLSDRLLESLEQWRPARHPQEDDITLLLVDIVPAAIDLAADDAATRSAALAPPAAQPLPC